VRKALAVLLVACSTLAFAQSTEVAKPDAATEERLKDLAAELRCLVCQNQTIADSNAPLAVDLRGQIRTQISQGRSDSEIRDYMVQRYGAFVLYRPPLNASTAILWVGPFVLLAFGAVVFVLLVRRKKAGPDEKKAPLRRDEIRELLEKD